MIPGRSCVQNLTLSRSAGDWHNTTCGEDPAVFIWNTKLRSVNVGPSVGIDLQYTKEKSTSGGRFWIQVKGKTHFRLKSIFFLHLGCFQNPVVLIKVEQSMWLTWLFLWSVSNLQGYEVDNQGDREEVELSITCPHNTMLPRGTTTTTTTTTTAFEPVREPSTEQSNSRTTTTPIIDGNGANNEITDIGKFSNLVSNFCFLFDWET